MERLNAIIQFGQKCERPLRLKHFASGVVPTLTQDSVSIQLPPKKEHRKWQAGEKRCKVEAEAIFINARCFFLFALHNQLGAAWTECASSWKLKAGPPTPWTVSDWSSLNDEQHEGCPIVSPHFLWALGLNENLAGTKIYIIKYNIYNQKITLWR